MKFKMKLASIIEKAMRVNIKPINNVVFGDVPESNPNSIVIEDGTIGFCLGENIPSGMCSPEVVGVSVTGDIFYGSITEADASSPDYWIRSAVNNSELLNQPAINYELIVNGIPTGMYTSVNNDNSGPGNHSDAVLIGWGENQGYEIIGRFFNTLGGLGFINGKSTEALTIAFKPTTVLSASLVTLLKKLYKLNKLTKEEANSEADLTEYKADSLLDNEVHIGNDGSVTFCISPILTIKPFPVISCEGAIESVKAFNGINITALKVNVTVQYLLESQIMARSAFDNLQPNQRIVKESFEVKQASSGGKVLLQDIVNASSYHQWWSSLPDNRGFRMGNDGVPSELLAIKIFIDAGDGTITHTKGSGDIGAFTVSEDGHAYYACLEKDTSVKSIWFNNGDTLATKTIGGELSNTIGSDGPISLSDLTLSIDNTSVFSGELVEENGDIVVKVTTKGLGTSIATVHITDKPDIKAEFIVEVYEGYDLTITNAPSYYQPINAQLALKDISLATNPSGKTINSPRWSISGRGDSSLDRARTTLYVGNGENTLTASAQDVAGEPITASFDILSYRADLVTGTAINVNEGGTFSLNIKLGAFKWNTATNQNDYTLLDVPEDFDVLLTTSNGTVLDNFTSLGLDPETKLYKYKAKAGINNDVTGTLYASLVSKTNPNNKSRSVASLQYRVKYVSPSLEASLNKSVIEDSAETKTLTLSGELIKFKPKDKVKVKIGNFNYLNPSEHKWVGDEIEVAVSKDGTFTETLNVPSLYDGTAIVMLNVEDTEGSTYDKQLTFDYVAPMIFKVQAPANILVFNGSSFDKNHEIDWGDGYTGSSHTKSFTGTDIHTVKVRTRKDNSAWVQRLWVKPYKELSTGVVSDPNSAIVEVVDWGKSSYAPTVQASLGLKALPATLPETVTSMERFLSDCNTNLPVIGSYDTSNVVNMENCLSNNPTFNQPINWNFSLVTKASSFLAYCSEYNQPMPYANFGSLKSAEDMFYKCTKLNQNFTTWCVPLVTATRNFAGGTLITADKFPVWGTCPAKPA